MLKPLNEYVVLSFEKVESKTESGIILSTSEKDKPSIGNVVALGPKVKDIKVGDKVVYQTYSGTKVKFDEKEYLIIKEENILAIYE
ncbi:GroES family chaperonin [Acholeplasma hippikon]|uniref:Co-chaperonin GroES n=1 Tax=Acholeplasma hippikon TaxID=264636 RepID=A0A449BIF6_9MOLU|nr:co-chaperone GroES [Acholeplasma hippikon]VEU82244.1 molecular chaperone GroES [Acholeplasma hippikon]